MKFLLPLLALLNSHGLLPDNAMIMSAGARGSTVQFAINRPNADCTPFYWIARQFLEGRDIEVDNIDTSNPMGSQFRIETMRDGVSEFSIECKFSEH